MNAAALQHATAAVTAPRGPIVPRPRVELREVWWVDPTKLNESDGSIVALPVGRNGIQRYRVRCKGQHCNIVNRNRRRYWADKTWARHTRPESAFMKRVRARRVKGQLEHPDSGRSNVKLAAIVITNVEPPVPETGEVFITFETMSTPDGIIVARHIEDGVGFGISSRGQGSTILASDGVDDVTEDFDPSTFDVVDDESTPGAEASADLMVGLRENVKRSRQLLIERAGGDLARAQVLADLESERALWEDVLPPEGANLFLLATPDQSGHYRAYQNGQAQWDVWFHPHNIAPLPVAKGMPTVKDAKAASEQHLRWHLDGGMEPTDAGGTVPPVPLATPPTVPSSAAATAPTTVQAPAGKPVEIKVSVGETQKGRKIRVESCAVQDSFPFSGVVVTLGDFTSEQEVNKAADLFVEAGFMTYTDGEDVDVYTTIQQPEMALAHVKRVLDAGKVEVREESLGFRVQQGTTVLYEAGRRVRAVASTLGEAYHPTLLFPTPADAKAYWDYAKDMLPGADRKMLTPPKGRVIYLNAPLGAADHLEDEAGTWGGKLVNAVAENVSESDTLRLMVDHLKYVAEDGEFDSWEEVGEAVGANYRDDKPSEYFHGPLGQMSIDDLDALVDRAVRVLERTNPMNEAATVPPKMLAKIQKLAKSAVDNGAFEGTDPKNAKDFQDSVEDCFEIDSEFLGLEDADDPLWEPAMKAYADASRKFLGVAEGQLAESYEQFADADFAPFRAPAPREFGAEIAFGEPIDFDGDFDDDEDFGGEDPKASPSVGETPMGGAEVPYVEMGFSAGTGPAYEADPLCASAYGGSAYMEQGSGFDGQPGDATAGPALPPGFSQEFEVAVAAAAPGADGTDKDDLDTPFSEFERRMRRMEQAMGLYEAVQVGQTVHDYAGNPWKVIAIAKDADLLKRYDRSGAVADMDDEERQGRLFAAVRSGSGDTAVYVVGPDGVMEGSMPRTQMNEQASGYGAAIPLDDPEDLNLDLDWEKAPDMDKADSTPMPSGEIMERARRHMAAAKRLVAEAKKRAASKRAPIAEALKPAYYTRAPRLDAGGKQMPGEVRLYFNAQDKLVEMRELNEKAQLVRRAGFLGAKNEAEDGDKKDDKEKKDADERAKKRNEAIQAATKRVAEALKTGDLKKVFAENVTAFTITSPAPLGAVGAAAPLTAPKNEAEKEDDKKDADKKDEKKAKNEAEEPKKDAEKDKKDADEKAKKESAEKDAKIRFLQAEVGKQEARSLNLAEQVKKLEGLLSEVAKQQKKTQLAAVLESLVAKHPQLGIKDVRDRLAKHESVEELQQDASSLLGLAVKLSESRPVTTPASGAPAHNGTAATGRDKVSSTSVSSVTASDAPKGPLAEGATEAALGGLSNLGESQVDLGTRTAAYRRRQRS